MRNVAIHCSAVYFARLVNKLPLDFAPCFAGCMGTTASVNRAAICIEMRTLPNQPLLTLPFELHIQKQNARRCECFYVSPSVALN